MRIRVRLVTEAYEGRALLGAALLPEDAIELPIRKATLNGSNQYGSWNNGYMPFVKAWRMWRIKVGSDLLYSPVAGVVGSTQDYTTQLDSLTGMWLLEGIDATGATRFAPLVLENISNPKTAVEDPYAIQGISLHTVNRSGLYFGKNRDRYGIEHDNKPVHIRSGWETEGTYEDAALPIGDYDNYIINNSHTGPSGQATCLDLERMFGSDAHIRSGNVKRMFFSAETQTFFCQFDKDGIDDWRIYKNGARVYADVLYYDVLDPIYDATKRNSLKTFKKSIISADQIDSVNGKLIDTHHPRTLSTEYTLKGSKTYKLSGSIKSTSYFRPCLVLDHLNTKDERPVSVITYSKGQAQVATFNYVSPGSDTTGARSNVWGGSIQGIAKNYECMYRVTASSNPANIYSSLGIENAVISNIEAQSRVYPGEMIVVISGNQDEVDKSQQIGLVLYNEGTWMMVDANKLNLGTAEIADIVAASTKLDTSEQSYIISTNGEDNSSGIVIPMPREYRVMASMITDIYTNALKIDTALGGQDSSIVTAKVVEVVPLVVDPAGEADKKANETDKKPGHTTGSMTEDILPGDRVKKGHSEPNYKSIAIVLGGITVITLMIRD